MATIEENPTREVLNQPPALEGYNDGMADFASVNPERLLTAYQIQLYDIDFAVDEVQRVAARGARCVQITPFPTEFGLPDVCDRRYDRLWAALADSGLTVGCIGGCGGRLGPAVGRSAGSLSG